MSLNKTDRDGYNNFYKDKVSDLFSCSSTQEYISLFENTRISPFYRGGSTKGYVRELATRYLIKEVDKLGVKKETVTILDAGCGQGELSVYLASKGFKVIGVDISEQACEVSRILANKIGVEQCGFQAASLESINLKDESVDFIIGHASLHHFIKYEKVAAELNRVLKSNGEMLFADSFGENKIYHLFHDKEQMERLGDVILTKTLIDDFFKSNEVSLVAVDWFVMIDKLLLKMLPESFTFMIRRMSFLWWAFDRVMPRLRLTLYFSGAIVTRVKKA